MSCEVCLYADEHGHWPGGRGTHCRVCHRSWTSTAQAHCVVCHEQFASNGVADKHWVRGVHTSPGACGRLIPHQEALGTVWRTQ